MLPLHCFPTIHNPPTNLPMFMYQSLHLLSFEPSSACPPPDLQGGCPNTAQKQSAAGDTRGSPLMPAGYELRDIRALSVSGCWLELGARGGTAMTNHGPGSGSGESGCTVACSCSSPCRKGCAPMVLWLLALMSVAFGLVPPAAPAGGSASPPTATLGHLLQRCRDHRVRL